MANLKLKHLKQLLKLCYAGFFSILIVSFSCSEHRGSGEKSNLMIGIAEVNYTPEVGLDLVGNYRGDDYASRGVHDLSLIHI